MPSSRIVIILTIVTVKRGCLCHITDRVTEKNGPPKRATHFALLFNNLKVLVFASFGAFRRCWELRNLAGIHSIFNLLFDC